MFCRTRTPRHKQSQSAPVAIEKGGARGGDRSPSFRRIRSCVVPTGLLDEAAFWIFGCRCRCAGRCARRGELKADWDGGEESSRRQENLSAPLDDAYPPASLDVASTTWPIWGTPLARVIVGASQRFVEDVCAQHIQSRHDCRQSLSLHRLRFAGHHLYSAALSF